ncbi:MAG: hypothetical protein AAF752_02270 [Bacteroidota bacterium]
MNLLVLLLTLFGGQHTDPPASWPCETEPRSGAEICLETSATLDCHVDYSSGIYDSCSVEVGYSLTTDYAGESSIDVDLYCTAEVDYDARAGYDSYVSDYGYTSANLTANDYEYGSVSLSVSFSWSDEVTNASIRSAACEIQGTRLW